MPEPEKAQIAGEADVREYKIAVRMTATVRRSVYGYFLGPCYLYYATALDKEGVGNRPEEALADLVRRIEGPLDPWPES